MTAAVSRDKSQGGAKEAPSGTITGWVPSATPVPDSNPWRIVRYVTEPGARTQLRRISEQYARVVEFVGGEA